MLKLVGVFAIDFSLQHGVKDHAIVSSVFPSICITSKASRPRNLQPRAEDECRYPGHCCVPARAALTACHTLPPPHQTRPLLQRWHPGIAGIPTPNRSCLTQPL